MLSATAADPKSGEVLTSDEALLLYSSFDGQADATFARGDAKASHPIPPEFEPGVRGQALLVGAPVENSAARNCYYSPEGNLHLDSGSVSFWVKPLDWDASTPKNNTLFHTFAGRNYFMIYKSSGEEELRFIRGAEGTYSKVNYHFGNWQTGQWQHVSATWSSNEVKLYINGRMVCVRQVRHDLESPAPVLPLSVGPGNAWKNAFAGASLIDEFRIHSRPLTQREVIELYERDADRADRDAGLITIGEKTPTLDGEFGDAEYSFIGSGFSNVETGMLSLRQSRYGLSYDRENFYFALQSDLAPGASVDHEEAALSVRPGGIEEPQHHFLFSPDGGIRHRREDGTETILPADLFRSRVADGIWTLEAAIPISQLTGAPSVAAGADWRINLTRLFSDPPVLTSAAPVAGNPAALGNLMKLALRSGAPSIRIASLYDLENYRSSANVNVTPTDPEVTIEWITTTDTTEKYGLQSHSHTLFGEGRARPFRAPQPPQPPILLQEFALNDVWIDEVRGGDRARLYQAEFLYEEQLPMKTLFFYTQDRSRLHVSAKRRSEGKIRVRFLRPDGTLAWSDSRDIPDEATYFSATFPLDFEQLSPGEYAVRVDHIAADGTATETWQQAYQVPGPDSPMLREYVDEEDGTVPAPWTPVETNGNTVETWGKQYDFNDGFLFASLKSQGEEVLAGPARLRLNGQPLDPKNPTAPEFISSDAMAASFARMTDLGAIQVSSEITTHFDGYCEVEMTLSPAPESVAVTTLSLDIPLRAEVASLVCDNKISDVDGSKSGAVGDYWNQDLADNPFFWVGNDRIGFNWLAPSLETWRFKEAAKNVEIIREGEIATVRLNLIDHPVALSEPLTIRFGFTLTPTRPLNRGILRQRVGKDWEKWVQPWKYFGVPDYETADRELIRSRSAHVDEIFVYMGEYAAPFSPEYPHWEEEWRLLLPRENFNYGEWYNRGVYSNEKLRDKFSYVVSCINSPSLRNYILHKRHGFFEKARVPLTPKAINYYFDTGIGTTLCHNEHHGCRPWTDAAGTPHGRLRIDEYRKIVLDTYRMIRRTGPDAKIMSHYGWLRVMPMAHFSDIILGGEGVENQIAIAGNYYDLLTPEKFRATFSPNIYGCKTVFLNMLARAAKRSPEKIVRFPDDPEAQRATRHCYGYCVTHDVDMWDGHKETAAVREAIWKAQDQLGWDTDVRFHPYWDKESPVRLTAPDSDRILASAYSREGGLMLAVLNDTDEVQSVSLKLDLEALGVTPGLSGRDAFETDREFVLADTWENDIPAREFRLIIWPRR